MWVFTFGLDGSVIEDTTVSGHMEKYGGRDGAGQSAIRDVSRTLTEVRIQPRVGEVDNARPVQLWCIIIA